MKSSTFLLLSTLALSAASVGAAALFPVEMGGRWGFADKSGKLVVNAQFDRAEDFSGKLAAVRMGKWGYADSTGHLVINPQFDEAGPFSAGLAAVAMGARYGYIGLDGKYVVNPQFDEAGPFAENLAAVKMDHHWGFIDKSGKFVINPQFDDAAGFSAGLAAVRMGKLYGYVDSTGKFVVNPQFDHAGSFSEGLAAVSLGGRWGFIDKTGKVIINPQFDDAGTFVKGLAPAKLGKSWGYVDTQGKFAINPQFDDAGSFVPPLALQGWDRVNQCKSLLRIVAIGAGELDGQRNSMSVAYYMTLAAELRSISGVGACYEAPKNCSHGTSIHDGARPVDLSVTGQPVQQNEMEQLPDTTLLPVAQSSPTTHPRAAAHLLRQHLPRNPTAQDKYNAGETCPVAARAEETTEDRWRWRIRMEAILRFLKLLFWTAVVGCLTLGTILYCTSLGDPNR